MDDDMTLLKRFTGSVLLEAVKAYKGGDISAGFFFYTDRAELYADSMGINIHVIREALGLPSYEKVEAKKNYDREAKERGQYQWINTAEFARSAHTVTRLKVQE